ncbi:cytochrome P450 [Candidatus Villigracilis saccharophilus]|uniref:cytochrome P450 n=1 Tax=Candidatus Villigracilis saccharophilus TaxID=3140684 RepID=UPI0031361B18|nr:cytochrome P450 [Anaerolineales bacterium]
MDTKLVLDLPNEKTANFGFMWNMLRNPLEALTHLAQDQGDIARVKLRKRDLFLLSHPDFIEQVLVKQQNNFIKGQSLQRARIILGDGLLTSEGNEHRAHRHMLQPAFYHQRVEEYLPIMNENTFRQMSPWRDGASIDMSDEMMRLTLNIALWSFFGNAPEGAVERVNKSMGTLTKLFPLTQLPVPDVLRRLLPGFKKANADLREVTESLSKNPRSEKAKNALIHILKENCEAQFTNEQIHAHTLTFLLAGHETTALLLTWCLDMLAHHPQVQAKLQGEVDHVLGDRFPHGEDLQNLPYTRTIIKETLRLRPPAWAIGRQAVQDCEIGGQHIAAGSTVLVSQWVTHHDARFYEDPHQFRPARWYEIENVIFPRYAYFPFGGGNRVCIGEHFAMTEAMAALAMMSRRWSFMPVQEAPAKPSPSITLRPNKNVKLIIGRRAV